MCSVEWRYVLVVIGALWQDRRPPGYASSLPPRVPDPAGSLIKFPFQPRLPLPPPLSPLRSTTVRPPLLYGCVHDALIKTRKLMLYAFESLSFSFFSPFFLSPFVEDVTQPLESCSISLINLIGIQLLNNLTGHFSRKRPINVQ